MKKYLILIALFLTGCESREESKVRNEQNLPTGCHIVDLDYGDLTAAVICDNRKTTSSVKSWNETRIITIPNGNNGTITQTQIDHHAAITAHIEALND